MLRCKNYNLLQARLVARDFEARTLLLCALTELKLDAWVYHIGAHDVPHVETDFWSTHYFPQLNKVPTFDPVLVAGSELDGRSLLARVSHFGLHLLLKQA